MSEYSPMGSRMPSRRNSMKSFGGRSSRGNSRRNSLGDSAVDGLQTKSRHAARATRLSAEIEAEGDDDVTNGMFFFEAFDSKESATLTGLAKSVFHVYSRETRTRLCLVSFRLQANQCRQQHGKAMPRIVQPQITSMGLRMTTSHSPRKNWSWQ